MTETSTTNERTSGWDERPPQPGIPPSRDERDRLLQSVRRWVRGSGATPPLTFPELFVAGNEVIEAADCDRAYHKWLAVICNSETWRGHLARIPYGRRLFLLPQCLRDPDGCEGTIDELGLLCAECGRCIIGELKAEAEELGYAVLVSEGTAVVHALIASGKIEGLVGVSCLSALEKVFPQISATAIPAVAVPLLYDGCTRTGLDVEWVREAMHFEAEDTSRIHLESLRREVAGWFTPETLEETMGRAESDTARLARSWMVRDGKRWRPVLAVGVARSLVPDADGPATEAVRKVAVAVECFHKASLVHDDIEDDDQERYGRRTLHAEHGVPVALNVGDFLLGEGYRLIGEADVPPEARARMLRTAARGHVDLADGQGTELLWSAAPRELDIDEVLEIFRKKTAPAFGVALRLGAIAAGAADDLLPLLDRYSEALGVAYQIRDDLADVAPDDADSDLHAGRPSIVLALGCRVAEGRDRKALEALWRAGGSADDETVARRALDTLRRLGADREARCLLDTYEEQALEAISPLTVVDLKSLLRRVISKIFGRIDQAGDTHDHANRHAGAGARGAEPAA